MKARLQTSLGQSLVMTPQLRQAIRLLQMSTLELRTEVAQAIEANPLLEWADEAEADAAGDGPADEAAGAAGDGDPDGPADDWADEGPSRERPGGFDDDEREGYGEKLGTENSWARRRAFVDALPEVTMCELLEANQGGSGPGVPSLGVVRPVEPPTLVISTRDDEQLTTWTQRAEAVKGVYSLFDDTTVEKPDFEVVPWRFRYHYRCASPGCNGHAQTIVDWEVVALWRKVRYQNNWEDLMRQKFAEQMWVGRDTVLFVGNQEQRPGSFLVLGIFWPEPGQQLTMF